MTVLDLVHYQYTIADKIFVLRTFENVLIKTATSTVLNRMFFTGVIPMAFSDGNMVEDIFELPQFEYLFGFSEEEIKVRLEQILLPSESSNDFINLHSELMIDDNINGYRFHPDQVRSEYT